MERAHPYPGRPTPGAPANRPGRGRGTRALTRWHHRSPDDDRALLGRLGEDAAARYLAARGYRIVARNVRADRVELDLIARQGAWLVFVEVKTRRGAGHGQAAEAVDPRKQRRLRHGARAWLASHPAAAQGARGHRFDVVTCVRLGAGARLGGATPRSETGVENETSAPDGARWSIEHWEAAF